MKPQGLLNFKTLEKMTEDFEITLKTLKLLSRIWESDVKEGNPFHTFLHNILPKFKILVSGHSLSHFVPIFKKTEENLLKYKGFFISMLRNKELHRKFAPILKVCQR